MKIRKNLLQEIANGETFLSGETVNVAKRIIESKRTSDFYRFAFTYDGYENNLLDVQDAILDYSVVGAKITFPVKDHANGKIYFLGMSIEESCEELLTTIEAHENLGEFLEGRNFRIRGSRKQYVFSLNTLIGAPDYAEGIKRMAI